MKVRRPTGLEFVVGVAFALGLVALHYWVEPLFWLVWNVMILVVGVGMAIWALVERWSLIYGFVAVGLGVAVHWWEMNRGLASGSCSGPDAAHWLTALRQIDACIDYSSGTVFHGQVGLISGAVVLFVRLFWWLGALRYRSGRDEGR